MKTEPQKEHAWLQQLVGEWTSKAEMKMAPNQPPETFTGTETVRSIGGIWVQGEGRGDIPGGGVAITQMTLGYDTKKQRFVGTFLGSMSDFLWVYDGELDASGKALTMYAEGPDMSPGGEGKMANYRDVIELKSDNHRLLRSFVQGDDGQWTEMMVASYTRT